MVRTSFKEMFSPISERSKTGFKDRAYEDRGARIRRDSCANTGDYARLLAVTHLVDRLKIEIAKSKVCITVFLA
jgi:hypothetical protein